MTKEKFMSFGYKPTSKAEVLDTLSRLGYKLNRTDDCSGVARIMTGPNAGQTYTATSLMAVEADTGLNFCNVNARKDANFQELQRLRFEQRLCWIHAGRLYNV